MIHPAQRRREYYWTGILEPALYDAVAEPWGITATERDTLLPVWISLGICKVTIKIPGKSSVSLADNIGTPPPAIPTITVPWTVAGVLDGGTAAVPTAGAVGPRPVAKMLTFSPRRAGLVRLAKEPSGRTTTARATLSEPKVWKIPGLAA